ncbi:MAG: hypothetical protein HYY13_00765 [Nitrospirae bacterium]|nr:hypothetical protein [Nitrospirota bacterium]
MLTAATLLFAKFGHAIGFILYRIAVWVGSVSLFRKGRATGRKSYYVLAVLTYVMSWVVVLVVAGLFWKRFSG